MSCTRTVSQSEGGSWGVLVYAGQTAWRVFLGGVRGWNLSSHKPLMEGHCFKIQEATKSTQVAAGGSLTLTGLLGASTSLKLTFSSKK